MFIDLTREYRTSLGSGLELRSQVGCLPQVTDAIARTAFMVPDRIIRCTSPLRLASLLLRRK
jgi:hypothetical protein